MRQKERGTAWRAAAEWALILSIMGVAGCRIDSKEHGDGHNVRIATPFGGMQVKTDTADILAGIGLPAYPGATLVKKDKENGKDDDGSADVNMSFGSFQLRVKAAPYRTSDSPERVMAFYKKALGRFGDVIQCQGKTPIGSPTHTREGLTCVDEDHSAGTEVHRHEGMETEDTKYSLKAGSHKHQHIVEITPENRGSKFSLVSLDLPTDFQFGTNTGSKNDKSDEQ